MRFLYIDIFDIEKLPYNIEYLNLGIDFTLCDGTIERSLADKEALFNIGYSQLISNKDINKLDEGPRKILFLFIVTQFFRTPYIRKDIQHTLDQFINKLAEKLGVKIPEGFRISADPESTKRIHLQIMLDTDIVFQLAEMLSNAEWTVLRNDTSIPLWTSDNPVLINNDTPDRGLGLSSKGREIYLVLYPQLCLTSFDPSTHVRPAVNLEYLNVIDYNCLQIRRSIRFIYSSDEDFSLARQFLLDYPQYKNPIPNTFVY